MFESHGVHAAAAGLGAGLAASANHGRVVRRSYETMLEAERATLAQTKAIEQYMKVGAKFETEKQWDNAEKSYKYVLQVVARRDGPGSDKGLPALQHLVTVSREQNKIDQAIDYQETALAFMKAAKIQNQPAVLSAQSSLSNLFLMKEDYRNAEPVLRNQVALYKANPTLPQNDRRSILQSYVKTLRMMHKDNEADLIEQELKSEDDATASKDAKEKAAPDAQSLATSQKN